MNDEARDLARYVASPMSETRQRRQRLALDRALAAHGRDGTRSRRFVWMGLGGGVATLVAAAALFVVIGRPERPSREGVALVSGTAPLALDLSDGSELSLEAGARIHVLRDRESGQVVELVAGAASFHVTRDAERTFEVRARGVAVRVLGTRFRVAVIDEGALSKVEVSVIEGSVHVDPGRGAFGRDLTANERWTLVVEEPVAAIAPRTHPSQVLEIEDPRARSEIEDPHARGEPVSALEAARRPRARSTAPTEAPDPLLDADALFERARRARQDGRAREAANDYALFVRTHTRDPRADVAAFELGRLLLDRLGDARGAIPVLRTAVQSHGPHQEDARARLVEAYERVGDRHRCRVARDEYLRRHPSGVHLEVVQSRCR
jgi:hypothetical protein